MTEALTSGAELNEYSARFYVYNDEKGGNDYLPKGGYYSVIKAIFDRYCHKAELKLNHVVKTIDYSADVIKLTTTGG